MKILYCNSIESNTGWGEEFFRAPALNLLDVETFNIDYRKNRYNLSKKIIENRDFDLFFLQKGDYFPLEIVKSIQRPKILYYTDLVQRFSSSDHLFKSKLFPKNWIKELSFCKSPSRSCEASRGDKFIS